MKAKLVGAVCCFLIMGCKFTTINSPNSSNSLPGTQAAVKTCDVLAQDVCTNKDAANIPCAYNYTEKRCEQAPARLFWRGQTFSAGVDFACAVAVDGSIKCWFSSVYSHEIENEYLARGGVKFESVSSVVHFGFEVITTTDAKGKIWSAGNLGDENHKDLQLETQFTDGPYVFGVNGYSYTYRCAVKENGSLGCSIYGVKSKLTGMARMLTPSFDGFCWIDNLLAIKCSQQEQGGGFPPPNFPQGQFESIAIYVDAPGSPACAIQWADRHVQCFGEKAASVVVTNTPKNLPVSQVAVSGDFAVAVGLDGKLHWWGDESKPDAISVRDDINNNGRDAMELVIAGSTFACAVKKDGTPLCFGNQNLKNDLAARGSFKVKVLPDVRFPQE